MSSHKLEDILIEQGLLHQSDLQLIYQEMKKKQLSFVTFLLTENKVKEPFILKALEKLFEIPAVDLKHYEIDLNALEIVPREFCEKYCLIPLQKAGATLLVAFSDPRQMNVIEELRLLSKCRIQPLVCTDLTIAQNIVRHYSNRPSFGGVDSSANTHHKANLNQQSGQLNLSNLSSDSDKSSKQSVVSIQQELFYLISEAKARNASVIDLDLSQKKPTIHLRIDDRFLQTDFQFASSSSDIFERIVMLGHLKTGEQNELQTFDFKFQLTNNQFADCRFYLIPQLDGYHCQIQIVPKKVEALSLEMLGLDEDEIRLIKNLMKQQSGLILLSGQNRQNLQMFQYGLLSELKLQKQYILSIENRVSIKLNGVHQIIEEDLDLRLKILRQLTQIQFDYLSMCEVEHSDELDFAFRYVYEDIPTLASIKTQDAATAIIKMIEMGVPSYMVNSQLQAVIGVKMLAKICEHCRVQIAVPQHVLLQIGVPQTEISDFRVFKGKGCPSCHGTGMSGKTPVIEILNINDKIREAINKGANAGQIRYLARESGMKSLRKSILSKINKGITTLEEFHFATMKEN